MVGRRQLLTGTLLSSTLALAESKEKSPDSRSSGKESDSRAVTLRDFGGVGDGVTDDTDALQRALNQCADGRMLIIPQGSFLVRRPIRAAGLINLCGYSGQASNIVLAGTASIAYRGSLRDDFAGKSQLTLRSVGFRCAAGRQTSEPVVSATFEGGRGGTVKTAAIEDVEITVLSDDVNLGTGLRLMNASNVKIDGLRLRGGRNNRAGSVGIDIGGDQSPVDMFLCDISGYFLERGVSIGGNVEGVYLSQSVFVAVDHGIYARLPSPSPLLFVDNCHINAFRSCIDIHNIVQFDISHNLFYAAKPKAPLPANATTKGFVAIFVGMHGNVGLTSRISANTVIGTTPIDIPKNGIYVDGQDSEFSVSIVDNELVGWDTAILLGSGAKGAVVSRNSFRSNRSDLLDLGRGNIGAGQKLARDGFVRNENGAETKWGQVIAKFESGRATVTFNPPFPNSVFFGMCTLKTASDEKIALSVDVDRSTPETMAIDASGDFTGDLGVSWIAIGH